MVDRPVPAVERTEPETVDIIPARTHKADRHGCIIQKADRTAELGIDHSVITDTSEILADQRLNTTREYQYRRPPANDNDAP